VIAGSRICTAVAMLALPRTGAPWQSGCAGALCSWVISTPAPAAGLPESRSETQLPMELTALIERSGARLLTRCRPEGLDVLRVYGSDKMSVLLNEASQTTLLATPLSGPQLLRLAELMDVPAICLTGATPPPPELVTAADKAGTVLLHSTAELARTCNLLDECLRKGGGAETP